MPDKFKAVWVSHSSISDFLACPRSYYLKNVYKDPKTNHKMTIMSAPLALGQAVHNVLEDLANIPTDKRFETPLVDKYEEQWKKISGENGGFFSTEIENEYKERGLKMIQRVQQIKEPLNRLAVKIDMDLPNYWLSEQDNIILCGKVDWLEYLKDTDSVNIVDFKTGRREENPDSLQLPIYHLLVKNCQKREVTKASYWYLETDDTLTEKDLPDLEEAHNKVLTIAKKIKVARQLESYTCPKGDEGCMYCKPFEKILNGDAQFVRTDEIKRDVYIMQRESEDTDNREGVLI
jgi:ATP-dependent helicase/DNAse subunit B